MILATRVLRLMARLCRTKVLRDSYQVARSTPVKLRVGMNRGTELSVVSPESPDGETARQRGHLHEHHWSLLSPSFREAPINQVPKSGCDPMPLGGSATCRMDPVQSDPLP